MPEIDADILKTSLVERISELRPGEVLTVMSDGKAIAQLTPAEPPFDPERARKAVDGLLEASRGVTLGGLKMKDLIAEGRR